MVAVRPTDPGAVSRLCVIVATVATEQPAWIGAI